MTWHTLIETLLAAVSTHGEGAWAGMQTQMALSWRSRPTNNKYAEKMHKVGLHTAVWCSQDFPEQPLLSSNPECAEFSS